MERIINEVYLLNKLLFVNNLELNQRMDIIKNQACGIWIDRRDKKVAPVYMDSNLIRAFLLNSCLLVNIIKNLNIMQYPFPGIFAQRKR